ncbi:hypothetical protein [Nocardia sp. SC052]|uniref:hypothetical protein n=1 Tax=Nocardia sichangensis TaxID=3385975 RepID=UPI0039A28BB6
MGCGNFFRLGYRSTWNLAGYRYGHALSGTPHRHAVGGLTDVAFRMIRLLEAGRDADWPF